MVGHALSLHDYVVHEALSSSASLSLASLVLFSSHSLLINPSAVVLLMTQDASLDCVLVGLDLARAVHGVDEVLLGYLTQHGWVVVGVKPLIKHLAYENGSLSIDGVAGDVDVHRDG